MDKEWAKKNKEIQILLSKESTFDEAFGELIGFRTELFRQITWIVEGYPGRAFYQMLGRKDMPQRKVLQREGNRRLLRMRRT